MRFAVIGCGTIGQVHAAAIAGLAPRARFALAVDEDPTRAKSLAAAHGADAVSSIDEALTWPGIDAVAVCTPSGTHADLAIRAMRAGKHVVVEKPLDVSLDAALPVARAQRDTGKTATVISQHRFDPSSQTLIRAVRSGTLGRLTSGVVSVSWWREQSYYDSAPWRGTQALDGGGALINQGIHTIDLLLWMLGTPAEVFAHTACLTHERVEIEDTATATIRFTNGALAVVHCTTAAYPGLTARLQIHGDRGSAVIDNDQLTYLYPNADPAQPTSVADRGAQPTTSAIADPTSLPGAAHAAQYQDFVAAIREDRPPLVTIEDGIRSLAVISAFYQSARTRQPVSIA
ncbi:Gfo/Idh/MocA family protein [Phytohabitans kaempferiae]|uniref:Gfo/Idh/MocA family protein n=1 Tax=Phytohabitans kaempferiae TaxID=1620943 RepID=A0ABV6MIQ4_9ACTN